MHFGNNVPSLILSRVGVTCRRVLEWMIGFIAPYTFIQLGPTSNTDLSLIYKILQFTVAHALGFSLFISRILTTDL
jgi:hypothetical protein